MSAATVFFSWQSDRPTKEGRNLIEKSLKTALERIAQDIRIDESARELTLDKDTAGVAGSPPVFDTILGKIDRAAVFVPDLTFVAARQNGDPIPNANVLIEYGYALKSIGHNRIVPVMNTSFGKPKRETMPFDLAHHRFPIQYEVPEGAPDEERMAQRDQLAKALESAVRAVLDSDAYKSSLAPVKAQGTTDWTLFDRRRKIRDDTLEFISFVLRHNGDFQLAGPKMARLIAVLPIFRKNSPGVTTPIANGSASRRAEARPRKAHIGSNRGLRRGPHTVPAPGKNCG